MTTPAFDHTPCPCDDCTYQRDNRAGSWVAVVLVLAALAAIGVALAMCT